jgi:hypothetical protein
MSAPVAAPPETTMVDLRLHELPSTIIDRAMISPSVLIEIFMSEICPNGTK